MATFGEMMEATRREQVRRESAALADAFREALATTLASPELEGEALADELRLSLEQFVSTMEGRIDAWMPSGAGSTSEATENAMVVESTEDAIAKGINKPKRRGDVQALLDRRAREIASNEGVSVEVAMGKLAKTEEGRMLKARMAELPLDEPEPSKASLVRKTGPGSDDELSRAARTIAMEKGISEEAAYGHLERDQRYSRLVKKHRAEHQS